MSRDDLVLDVKRSLASPRRVARLLGLKARQGNDRYVLVCCPMHGEKRASMSLYRHDGIVKFKCHGCQETGDVLTLVAVVYDLDISSRFPEVLATAADLAGMLVEAEAIRDGKPAPERKQRPEPKPEPERTYPPANEVAELWETGRPVTSDAVASLALVERLLDPVVVAEASLARVLHPQTHWQRLPMWARYRGPQPVSQPWTRTGHRMIVPAYDCDGAMRSIRAWRIEGDPEFPKRVPPSGFRTSGLVLANARAVEWLRGRRTSRIIVCEGEPDALVRMVTNPNECVIGIISGSWHDGFTERVPYGSQVVLLTHLDDAGDRYADEIQKAVESRAIVERWTLEETAA